MKRYFEKNAFLLCFERLSNMHNFFHIIGTLNENDFHSIPSPAFTGCL